MDPSSIQIDGAAPPPVPPQPPIPPPEISWLERSFLKAAGLVHGVKGRLEHPQVAEEALHFATQRARSRARGRSLHDRGCCGCCGRCDACCDPANSNAPRQPIFRYYAKKPSLTLKSVNDLQAEDPSFRNWTESVDEFEDIEGGHKRFNRSWLTSKNPMTAPEKTIMEGDEALFSQGILEEIWNMLVNVWGWKRLLLFNLSCELLLIFGFAIILTGVAAVEGAEEGPGPNGFVEKLRLALCTVRLSTDSVFGWEERKPSTGMEIVLLTVEGWIHWLLLNIFSAIIVARALRPRRALVFAPGETVLAVSERCCCLRT